ncbi:DNA topoisomerase IV [Pseudomonas segetis]
MRRALYALLLLAVSPLVAAASQAMAQPEESLKLVSEHPVDGMSAGNLSGFAWCGDALWAVSDRDDGRIYRLSGGDGVWQAEPELFTAPPAPDSGLPWGIRMRAWATGLVRGGSLDFEGMTCDSNGNRYLVSEAKVAVLQLPVAADPEWLRLPESLVRQARGSGMLLHFNALLESIAIDPAGERMWLAAERQRRGLLVLHKKNSVWGCTGGCVLLSESGKVPAPEKLGGKPHPKDFSDVSYYAEKLFTLERQAHRICRRTLSNGEVERCWSFADQVLTDARRYPSTFGRVEALQIDEQGAWLGVDNGGLVRADGESRPIVWRFAAPKDGWEHGK